MIIRPELDVKGVRYYAAEHRCQYTNHLLICEAYNRVEAIVGLYVMASRNKRRIAGTLK